VESPTIGATLGQQDGNCTTVTSVQYPLHFRPAPKGQGGIPINDIFKVNLFSEL
jgi:hypothetical protein